jgi:hypothetical protein
MDIDCNPYHNVTCDTVPSQGYTELWEDAVCAIQYNMTFVDDNQCPTEYRTLSYPSLQAAEADDAAALTHYGSCGVCSSLQDLALYVQNPDLTTTGQECGIKGIADEESGINCFMDVGYTKVSGKIVVISIRRVVTSSASLFFESSALRNHVDV